MSRTNRMAGSAGKQRPEFMALLGLMPPYSLDDVKEAYRIKVQLAHPDHGGSTAGFRAIQEAYEQAQEYVKFRTDKRAWIAAQVDRYNAQQEVESKLRSYGAEVSFRETDWLRNSFGDFAELATSLDEIMLADSKFGREALDLIALNHRYLSGLKRLTLKQCQLRDGDVMRLSCFQALEHLDVSGNPVTHRVVELAAGLPMLKSMITDDTGVNWWSRSKLALLFRRRKGASQ